MKIPQVLRGGISADDRGEVVFVNDFHFDSVKRFYVVQNHRAGFVRAWHAHKKEAKYVFVSAGSALVGAVVIDNWEKPDPKAVVHRFTLSSHTPAVLFVPAGYANGFMSLTADATLIFFSTASMEETKGDDVRYDARYWDIWNVVER